VTRVLFFFELVAHYHAEMFRGLERRLEQQGIELHLASGEVPANASGRVGLRKKVLNNERKFGYSAHKIGSYTLRRAAGVGEAVKELRPAVVVCMAHVGNFSHWWLALNKRRYGYRLVAWQSGFEYHPGWAKDALLDIFVPRFDHHLAYHSNARDYALQHGSPPACITVMHNTINEARITRQARGEAHAQLVGRHPSLAGKRIVLFVGAVMQEKRVEVLIEAMARLARPELALVVVGDGPHLPQLRALCAGRADVVLAGSVIDGVGSYFDAAEVFAMPGTGGLGLNEAMAHGLPLLSSYADGSADDLVVDGQTGFRLRQDTAAELAERLAQLLDDPELAANMGRTAQAWSHGKFAFDRFLDRIEGALVQQVRLAPPA
jgi:glycosyltransferase involved in cell wall biosynthesis